MLQKFLLILCIASGLSSLSSYGMEKFKSQVKSAAETGTSGAQANVSAVDGAAQAATKVQDVNFSAAELEELELRAQAYIKVSALGGDMLRRHDSNDARYKALSDFILHMNDISINRFLSFFKNKKNIGADEFFEGKQLFSAIKEKVGAKAQHVFRMIADYSVISVKSLREGMHASVETESKVPQLIDALCALDADRAETLLKSGVNPMEFDANDCAPIYYALAFQSEGMIALLAKYMPDDAARKQLVNLKNNKGLIPLLLVAPAAQEARVMLEKYGADINHVDAAGATPLRTAIVAAGNDEDNCVATSLIAHKARVVQEDYDYAAQVKVADSEIVKSAFASMQALLKAKINEREQLTLKLKKLAEKSNGSKSAAAGETAAAARSGAKKTTAKDAKHDGEGTRVVRTEKEVLARIAQLSENDLEDLERRAKAFVNVDNIITINGIPAQIKRDTTLFLMEDVRREMKQRCFARFLSFFKGIGLSEHQIKDKKIIERIVKKALPFARQVLEGILIKIGSEAQLVAELYRYSVTENNELEGLIDAICAQDDKAIDRSTHLNINPNQFDRHHFAPIYYAVMLNQERMIQKLIKAAVKADINLINVYGLSALLIAHPFMNISMHRCLIANGAQLDTSSLEAAVTGMHQRNSPKLTVIAALAQNGVMPTLALQRFGLKLYESATNDKDKALYAEMMEFLGMPIIEAPSLDAQLKQLTDWWNSPKGTLAEPITDTWSMGSRRGNAAGLNAVAAPMPLRGMIINPTQLTGIVMDNVALEQFKLSQEEVNELETIAQASFSVRKGSKKLDELKRLEPNNTRVALLANHYILGAAQIELQFQNFFMVRNIHFSKFQYDDFAKRVQEKVGPKACKLISKINIKMKTVKMPLDSKIMSLKADKKLLLLLAAVIAQDIPRVKQLLKDGASPILEDDQKLLPMHYAIMSALINPAKADEIIGILIEHGANVNNPNFFGSAPILLAHEFLQLKNPAILKPVLAQATLIRAIHASRSEGPFIVKALIDCGLSVGEKECKLIDKLLLNAQRLPKNDPRRTTYITHAVEMQKILREAKKIQDQKVAHDEKAQAEAEAKEKRDKKLAQKAKNKEAREALEKQLREMQKQENAARSAEQDIVALVAIAAPASSPAPLEGATKTGEEIVNENRPTQAAPEVLDVPKSGAFKLSAKEMAAYKKELERERLAELKRRDEEYGNATPTLFASYVPPTRLSKSQRLAQEALQPSSETPVVIMPAQQQAVASVSAAVVQPKNNRRKPAASGVDTSRSGSAAVTKKMSASAVMKRETEEMNRRFAAFNEQKRKAEEEKQRKEKESAQKALEEEMLRKNQELAQMQACDTFVAPVAKPMATGAPSMEHLAQAKEQLATAAASRLRIKVANTSSPTPPDVSIESETPRFESPTKQQSEAFKKRAAQAAEEKRAKELAALAQDQARIRATALATKQKLQVAKQKEEDEERVHALEVASLQSPVSLRGTAQDVYERHVQDYNIAQRNLRRKQLAMWQSCGGSAYNFAKNPPTKVLDEYQKMVGPLTFENRYSFGVLDHNNRRLNGTNETFANWLKLHRNLTQGIACQTCQRFDNETQKHVRQLCSTK
jgi:ankyrin repeat protein